MPLEQKLFIPFNYYTVTRLKLLNLLLYLLLSIDFLLLISYVKLLHYAFVVYWLCHFQTLPIFWAIEQSVTELLPF